jgi:adenylate cyclase
VRVVRTFGFVDLVGFTSFCASNGDDEAVGVLVGMCTHLRAVAPAYGVRIAKWLGDGAMLVGVEAVPLLETILALQEEFAADDDLPLELRAGAVTGEVLLCEGDDHAGMAVNLAARLCDVGAPGELWVPADLADIAPEGTVRREVGPVGLPGLRGPIPVTALVTPLVAVSAGDPAVA